jgi:hypothetical protein
MALTASGLANGGDTVHYRFQYDDSLTGGLEPARTNAVVAACEGDFNLMTNWFRGTNLDDVDFRIPVNVTQNAGGASWGIPPSSRSLTVTINPGLGDAPFVRYLLVSEMVEQFMRAHKRGWFGSGTEGSQGEGLSRFLARSFLALNGLGYPPADFANSNRWLASTRLDYVNNIRAADDGPDEVTGCSLLFIYFLSAQLGFSIEDIIAAGANTLGGVFRNLTGELSPNPFPRFKRLVDSYFPGTSTIAGGNLDNPFPLKKLRATPGEILWHNSVTNETQIWFWDGHRVTGRATVLGEDGNPAFVGPPWTIVGNGHFNLAGNADIVWHNSETNETQIWFMDRHRVTSRATVLGEDGNPVFVGQLWSIVGTGGPNGDAKSEIVWHNSETNETQIWFMDRHRVTSRATVLGEDGNPVFVGQLWSIVGAGDFTENGVPDIIWHNSETDETQIWFMGEGAAFNRVTSRGTVLGEDGNPVFVGQLWSIVGTGDSLTGDEREILWHNSETNETQVWFMRRDRVVGRGTVLGEDGNPAFVGPPWSIVGTSFIAAAVLGWI